MYFDFKLWPLITIMALVFGLLGWALIEGFLWLTSIISVKIK